VTEWQVFPPIGWSGVGTDAAATRVARFRGHWADRCRLREQHLQRGYGYRAHLNMKDYAAQC
jgi:hypothetical protein